MRRWAVILLSAGLVYTSPAADYPPADHGGADLILADGDRIWGAQRNIGRFEVPEGAEVDVHRYYPDIPGSGTLDVYAEEILIAGEINAEGAGYTGGGGSGAWGVDGTGDNYDGVPGETGPPRYEGYDDDPFGWLHGSGDGPAHGIPQRGYWDVTLRNGGYDVPNLNTDTTTDLSVLMGSGGAGGYPFLPIYPHPYLCTPRPQGGHGGTGGGPGGGAIRLFAERQLKITWIVKARGAMGGGGHSGGQGGIVSRPGEPCEYSGADGGRGGSGDALNSTSMDAGSGAGGGILLYCDEHNGLEITGYVDARSSETNTGPGMGFRNGGTIKLFYRGDEPSTDNLRGGCYYLRNLDEEPLPKLNGWILSERQKEGSADVSSVKDVAAKQSLTRTIAGETSLRQGYAGQAPAIP